MTKYRYRQKKFVVHVAEPERNNDEIIDMPYGAVILDVKPLPSGEVKELDKPNRLGNLFETVTQDYEIRYLEIVKEGE